MSLIINRSVAGFYYKEIEKIFYKSSHSVWKLKSRDTDLPDFPEIQSFKWLKVEGTQKTICF